MKLNFFCRYNAKMVIGGIYWIFTAPTFAGSIFFDGVCFEAVFLGNFCVRWPKKCVHVCLFRPVHLCIFSFLPPFALFLCLDDSSLHTFSRAF